MRAGAWVRVRARDGKLNVEETLAEAGSALAGLYAIAAKHGLDPVFPDAVVEQVEALVASPGLDDPELRDERERPYVSIDGATSRDLDQAVFIERDPGGGKGYVARYALADAAYYVRPGTPLFDEALKRGASYYLPGFMIPMLPRELSEGIISLNPDVDRRAMVFEMRIDENGACTATSIVRSKIRSHAKLSFGGVQDYYDNPDADSVKGDPRLTPAVRQNLDLLKEVGLLRMKDAERRDVVRYRRTELSLGVGDRNSPLHGHRLSVNVEPRRMVDRYNEQMSLLCNVEGAQLLRRGDKNDEDAVHPIYRVHPRPDRDKVSRFESLLGALARSRGLPKDGWTWSRGGNVSLNDFLSALPRFESGAPEGRVARAVHRQAVMVNLRSSFSDEPGRHHGVGADVYARFSAPMREIVGVFLHKEMWEMLAGKDADGADDDTLREHIVERANAAKRTQSEIGRAAHLAVLDQMFADAATDSATPTRFGGTLMGITRSKIHVTFDQPPVDVKVYTRDLETSRGALQMAEHGAALADSNGEILWRIGDPIDVVVDRFDASRRRWILDIV